MLRLVMTLLAGIVLLGGSRLPFEPRTFEDHAAQAVGTWRTSGAAEIWHKGFVPVEDLSAIPPKVLKQIQHDEEYGWVVAGPLPAPPAGAQIRWDDGSTMRVPVITAREALLAVSPWPEEYTFPEGEAYKLTSATYTRMRLKTLRGMATVPAWRLYFSNLPGPIDRVAVDQKAVGTVKAAVGDQLPGSIRDFEVLDERTLLVSYDYGSCDGEPLDVRLRLREEPDLVVLGIDVHGDAGGICGGVGMSGKDVIRLHGPLGDRVVLDAVSRLPVLCDRALNACRSGNG
ncbi:hypothetical protein [Nonomuraea sp. NEAU-A123]|uniref:hypothetical protein n=1 Tax=Nonomuraea sp. NEAU-A123 TaxID=2839649 RepID=UPI001BE45ED9|nr:hypothetical protein [Nonomuraea sp. NEAU-A123]MBT2232226.1 hypothetical protein [Nonomuraea sp. NEAU-A123]